MSARQPAARRCPACDSRDVVRVLGSLRPWLRPSARCIACAHVFAVSRSEFQNLREPNPTELVGAGLAEQVGYVSDGSMSAGHVVLTLVGVVVGAGVAFRFDTILALPPAILAGWWLGRLAFPSPLQRRRPGPGACATCGYELRGLPAGHNCPECGTEFGSSRATGPDPTTSDGGMGAATFHDHDHLQRPR